jgi:glycosyltransferase involved in cell wall biosynthesis
LRKLLVVASSLDLRAPLSSTPSWWQLLKALAEQGVELVVAPYQGPAIESPWWGTAANPCQREGDFVGWLKRLAPARRVSAASNEDSAADRLTRQLVERFTKPRWRLHLVQLIERQGNFDAVLFLTVPPNHFGGIPRTIEHRFGLPTYFYDGDVPASLPRFAGFHTGFRIYQGADLSEYAGVFSSSKGGVDDLVRSGARGVSVLYYGADPSLFSPRYVEQDIDVFFYGHGREYREQWIDAMLGQPSQQMPDTRFAVRGTRLGAMPRVGQLRYASFSKLKDYCSRSRINLLITRQAHATVYASSTARPFELAALGCAMVSNPYLGIEEWFEPGREILLVNSAREAVETYRQLTADQASRRALGERARARLLAEHTYAHRAAQLRTSLWGDAGPRNSQHAAQPTV